MIRSYRNFKESGTAALNITERTVAQISTRTTGLEKATTNLSTDKEDLLQIFLFLCLNFRCFHVRLKLIQAKPNITHQSLPIP